MSIVLKALEEPVRQIALNSGLEGSVIIDKMMDYDDYIVDERVAAARERLYPPTEK